MCWLWRGFIQVNTRFHSPGLNLIIYLYSSSSKFDSGCGWPAFSSSIGSSVRRERDVDGHREEILCANCDGHLGHVFRREGFRDSNGKPIDERHCVNSASLNFIKKT
jgi:peptide-methionine (R)-S-oxide reductase